MTIVNVQLITAVMTFYTLMGKIHYNSFTPANTMVESVMNEQHSYCVYNKHTKILEVIVAALHVQLNK